MQRIYFFNKQFSSALEIGQGNSNHMTFATQMKVIQVVTAVIFCTQLKSNRKGPGFQSRCFPNRNYSHVCGCLCTNRNYSHGCGRLCKQATFTTFIERGTFSVSSLCLSKAVYQKKEKYWSLSIFFLSLGSIFKRCFSLYALYIQYSRNRTKCLDTLIVNQVDVQNNFCTTNDQIAHGTWMNIFLYVVQEEVM